MIKFAQLPGTSLLDAVAALRALPTHLPVLIELIDLHLEDDDNDIGSFFLSRTSPVVAVCQGQISGRGALRIVDMATVCIGDSTCRLPSDETDLSLLTRRGASLRLPPSLRRSVRSKKGRPLPLSDPSWAVGRWGTDSSPR